MSRRLRIIVNSTPGPPAARATPEGEQPLLPLDGLWGEELHWRQPRRMHRLWRLESSRGAHVELRSDSAFERRWRARSAAGAWKPASRWPMPPATFPNWPRSRHSRGCSH